MKDLSFVCSAIIFLVVSLCSSCSDADQATEPAGARAAPASASAEPDPLNPEGRASFSVIGMKKTVSGAT